MFPLIIIFLSLLLFPEITSAGVMNGIQHFIHHIFPALYPFVFLVSFIQQVHIPIHLSKYFYLMTALIGGYPLGSKIINDHYTLFQKSNPDALLVALSLPSPSFFITYIGYMCFNNIYIGMQIFSVTLFSNLCIYIIFNKLFTNRTLCLCQTNIHNSSILSFSPEKIFKSAFSILFNIGNYVLLFSILNNFINQLLPLPPLWKTLCIGSMEITSGFNQLMSFNLPIKTKIMIATFFCSFNGLCIIFQTISMIDRKKFSIKKYMIEKTSATILAISIMYILLYLKI